LPLVELKNGWGVTLYQILQKAFFLHILLISLTAFSGNDLQVQFTRGVPADQQKQIRKDFDLLWRLRFDDQGGELSRILKIPSLHPDHLQAWLAKRVKYIMHSGHQLDSSVIKTLVEDAAYPNMIANARLPKKAVSSPGSGTMMINVGTALYKGGKDSGELYSINLSGIGAIAVNSPRVGIFKIGNIFFDQVYESPVTDIVHSVFRLATFFHEARHTDGHGPSLGFLHTRCPKNHAYEGLLACDIPGNGPYRIGGLFINSMIKDCADCSEGQKDALKVLRNDNLNRVLSGTNDTLDEYPNEELCELNVFTVGGCDKGKRQKLEWADEPEKVK
jgi:hypothetical protein